MLVLIKFVMFYLLILFFGNTLSDTSASFCLCALKSVLKDYALLSTDRLPPRYHSAIKNDIGFFVLSNKWKAVNNATWIELGSMINAPEGMYTRISLDGINPINNGLSLDGLRSAHLTDIITGYRLIIDKVNIYHTNIIRNRTKTCSNENKKSVLGFSLRNKWEQFFVPRTN
jgi:hypothetical protein